MGIGKGTNIVDELLSLWGLLWFAKKRGLLELNVYGDSKVIIDWENGLNYLQCLGLSGWMRRVRLLSQHFQVVSFSHIY